MKIYKRNEFLALPPGVIYSPGFPWAFESLYIKEKSIKDDEGNYFDFYCCCLINIDNSGSDEWERRLTEMLSSGKSYPLNLDGIRDGGFCEDEIYLVYEKDDLLELIKIFTNAINLDV